MEKICQNCAHWRAHKMCGDDMYGDCVVVFDARLITHRLHRCGINRKLKFKAKEE